MKIDFHALSFKAKRLYERISASNYGVYQDSLSEPERNIVGILIEAGLVERFYGSWSGETVYKACSQRGQ